ncbi:MAG TPA: trypsin-like peptidase domain-containing protein [Rubrivivax sp.]
MKPLVARALAVLLLLSALAPGAGAGVEADRAALLQLAASVWKIEVQRAQGGFSLGSGVAVSPDLVLTNCHVTRDASAVFVLRGGRRWRAEAQAVDAEHDLCLLRVPGLAARAVALGSSRALWPGNPVWAFGYTGGMELQHTRGQVVALHRLDGAHVVQSSNAFTSGASGGGLFDEQMRLVGILTFRLRGGSAHYFSAPIEWLLPLLDGSSSPFVPVQPLDAERRAYWQLAPAAQPNFLRAAVFERERRWDELEALAFNWTRADADDPQPWYLHGLALSGLQRWTESQRALERSVQLEPTWQQAWFHLGLVNMRQGQFDRARQARGTLEGLNAELASELDRAIDGQ